MHNHDSASLHLWAQKSLKLNQIRMILTTLSSHHYAQTSSALDTWWKQVFPPALRQLLPTPKSTNISKSTNSLSLHLKCAFKIASFNIKSSSGYFNFSSDFEPLGCAPLLL